MLNLLSNMREDRKC